MDEHVGHRQRLRDRFREAGLAAFAPHEALELLLCYAIPRRDTKPIAKALIERFGSFHQVLGAGVEELMTVPGVGEQAAVLISMMLPLSRLYQQSALAAPEKLREEARKIAYCRSLLHGERYEKLYVLALDHQGGVLSKALISSGDEGETAVYPRLIVAALLRAGASAALLCHNHPGAEAKPSQADIKMTAALVALLKPLQMRLDDHIIIAGGQGFSFRAAGLLQADRQ